MTATSTSCKFALHPLFSCYFTLTFTDIGLGWTYASIFQMLRGSTVIYTGIFSVLFLKQKLKVGSFIILLVVLSPIFTSIGKYLGLSLDRHVVRIVGTELCGYQ